MADLITLNAEYGIPEQVLFTEGPGGLVFAELTNIYGHAVIALQGGHLISWVPRERRSVIWLSPDAKFASGKSIRGGIPVCWPWFGDHPRESSFPAHGFARTTLWRVMGAEETSAGGTRLVLNMEQNNEARQRWPFSYDLILSITLGAELMIELVTRNIGITPITIGEALHTYFEVADVRNIAIHGLDGCEYLDKVDGMVRKRQAGPITFNGEIDRVYMDTVANCFIDDPGFNHRIHISKRGSLSTVVWNPWIEKAAKMGDLGADGYLKMVCVESANAAGNAVSIAAGDEHRLVVTYRLESLPSGPVDI